MNKDISKNSCVETPVAPIWLSKLEDMLEKLKHTKLEHESGSGAPCSQCKDKCPGLDLHYWRKICRNCKCRKTEHICTDEDTAEWYQFEILGQIRSKPAFVQLKKFQNQYVQVDWVPPNSSPKLISDYMDNLEISAIPVYGSIAATRRKQQLEFQVPPHDLNSRLCDNLSEFETDQMHKYIKQICQNFVGQGDVIRINDDINRTVKFDENIKTKDKSNKETPLEVQKTNFKNIYFENDDVKNNVDNFNMPQEINLHLKSIDSKVNAANKYGTDLQNNPIRDLKAITNSNNLTNNQQEIINCHKCKKRIYNGEVGVKVNRAEKNMIWHPQCFKCHLCDEMLADLVYFYHTNEVYCGRDLAIKLGMPRCKACDELIFTKEYTAAENATYHIKHFCCYNCDIPLAGKKYIPDDETNIPHCIECYNKLFATNCLRCRSIIGPEDKGVSWENLHWHEKCFICAGNNCGKSLVGCKFCVKNSMLFCSSSCIKSILK